MKLLCLDSNSILNRAFYGIKLLTTRDGSYTNAIYGFLNILFKLLGEVQPDGVAFAFDLKAPTFRHKLYTGYKAQRKGMPQELAQQLPVLQELLGLLGYRMVTQEGYEADDLLGTLSARCEEAGHQCFIATGDRDSLQLIGPHTTVLLASSRMGQSETTPWDQERFAQMYGTTPPRLVDIKALMGDSSDNIPGVAGIGEKTALALVAQFGDLDNLYQNLDDPSLKKSVREKLERGREDAYLSRTLATIDRQAPLGCTLEDFLPQPVQRQQAYALLTRLEMPSIVKRLGLEDCAGLPCREGEEAAPALQVGFGTQAVERLLGEEGMLRFLLTPDALAVCGGEGLAITDASRPGWEQVTASLLTSPRPKGTFDCKAVFVQALERGLEVEGMEEDLMLSAYLLNANDSSYSVENLRIQYQTTAPVLELGEVPPPLHRLAEDCAALPQLAQRLGEEIVQNGQDRLLREMELPLARVLASMEQLGFAVDSARLQEYGAMLDRRIEEIQQQIYRLAGESFNINSPKQLGVILFDRLGLPAGKKTKTGYSTNAEVLESLRGKHPIVEHILEFRQVAKLKSTYVEGLLKVVGTDGRIHSHFNQTDTRTGRLSSTEPNLQNIPVRTQLGSRLRAFFHAREGCVLVDADYSQIELRVLAHIAQDENMIAAFASGEDIHTNTASQVFGLPPLFVTPEQRRRAKAVNFGIVYGIGAFSLANDIGVPVAEADRYIKQYLQTFSGVKGYMDSTIQFAKAHGYVETLSGRRRYLPEIQSKNRNLENFGRRVAMNTPIQGTAADIIKLAMIRVYRRLKEEGLAAQLILQVHDELIVEAPQQEAPRVRQLLKEEMEAAMELRVKLTVEVGEGKTWYDAK